MAQSPAARFTVSADFAHPGTTIPSDFPGMSVELCLLNENKVLTPSNTQLIGYLNTLSPSGIIRVGGNSSDAPGASANAAALTSFRGFLDRLGTGWTVIYGLNLQHGTPAQAASDAKTVTSILGPHFNAVQLGNEPDGAENDDGTYRWGGWHFGDFSATWKAEHDAVVSAVAGIKLYGPDLGWDTGFLKNFVNILGSQVSLYSVHYYPNSPNTSVSWLISQLLSAGSRTDPRGLATWLQTAATLSASKPWRATESNPIDHAGQNGVSNASVAAYWAIDTALTLSRAGWIGMNLHTAPNALYGLATLGTDGNWHPSNIYHGFAFWRTYGMGRIVPVTVTPTPPASLRIFAVLSPSGVETLFLENLSQTDVQSVEIPIWNNRPLKLHTFHSTSLTGTADYVNGVPADYTGAAYREPGLAYQAQATVLNLDPVTVTAMQAF